MIASLQQTMTVDGCCFCDQPLVALHFSFITVVFVNFAKMELEEQRAGRAIRILSLQSWFCTVSTDFMEEGTANCLAAASVASYLAPFLEFFVGVPFCLPTSHAVIDLVSAARI